MHSFLHLGGVSENLLRREVDEKTVQKACNAVERSRIGDALSRNLVEEFLVARMSETPVENNMSVRMGEHFDRYEDAEQAEQAIRARVPGVATVPELDGLVSVKAMQDRLKPRLETREKRRQVARDDWRPVPGMQENPALGLPGISDGGFAIEVLTWGYDFRSMMRKWHKAWCYVTSELGGVLDLVEQRPAVGGVLVAGRGAVGVADDEGNAEQNPLYVQEGGAGGEDAGGGAAAVEPVHIGDPVLPVAPLHIRRHALLIQEFGVDLEENNLAHHGCRVPAHLAKAPFRFEFRNGGSVVLGRARPARAPETSSPEGQGEPGMKDILLTTAWAGSSKKRPRSEAEGPPAEEEDGTKQESGAIGSSRLAVVDLWPWCRVREHWGFEELVPLDHTLRECVRGVIRAAGIVETQGDGGSVGRS